MLYAGPYCIFFFICSDSSHPSEQFFYAVSNRAMGWFAYVEHFSSSILTVL